MLIVFEGVDGSGKTTVAKTFAEQKGFLYTREPTFSSEEADRLNLDSMSGSEREIEFMIDRIRHQGVIKNNTRVAADRYLWSALAYSRYFSSNMYSFLRSVYTNSYFTRPDCYVMVKARMGICRQRSSRAQSDQQLKGLQKAYDDTSTCLGSRIITIDNSGDIEDTMKVLYHKLGKIVPELGATIIQTSMFHPTERQG